MKYKVSFTKHATKELLKLPSAIREIILRKIKFLANDPYAINNNIKKLQGIENCYRIRIGDHRVIYRIIKTRLIIEIIKIGHRQEIYQ